jgi:hypothetical protein
MATPIGNLGSDLYSAIGKASAIREDLADFVAMIDPFETPLTVVLPRTSAKNVLHEWLQDSLRARNTRGIVEGRDWEAPTHVAPTRETNHTEIFLRPSWPSTLPVSLTSTPTNSKRLRSQ